MKLCHSNLPHPIFSNRGKNFDVARRNATKKKQPTAKTTLETGVCLETETSGAHSFCFINFNRSEMSLLISKRINSPAPFQEMPKGSIFVQVPTFNSSNVVYFPFPLSLARFRSGNLDDPQLKSYFFRCHS